MGRRRILHHTPKFQLFFKKRRIILGCRRLNAVVIGAIGLNHRGSRPAAPARPARRLHQKLKGPLCRPVITPVEGQIRRQHANQRHAGEIMSFYNHLGTHQNIRLSFGKCLQNLFVATLLPGGIEIHAENPRSRKCFPCRLCHLLGSRPEGSDISRSTGGTFLRRGRLVSAVMADHPASSMKGQRHIAMWTFYHMSAGSARNKARIAPPIQEKHDLLTLFQTILHKLLQTGAENGTISQSELFPKIHHLCLRHSPVFHPGRKLIELISALPGVRVGVYRRRSRSQHHKGSAHAGALDSRLPGMVPGRVFTFIAALMFLVHDDNAQSGKWRK